MNAWERDQHEYRERKADSVDAAWFLFLLMLGTTLVATAHALFEAWLG